MNQTVVITGAGGVLCSSFAKAMAKTGAPIALLDLNAAAAETVAEEIRKDGGKAKAYGVNVLDKASLQDAHDRIVQDFGKCRVLINGAGGNNPKCTTAHETYQPGDEDQEECKTFFNLDKEGFDFVFSLNLMGSLLPTQVFAKDMLGEKRLLYCQYIFHERIPPADQNSGIQRRKGGGFQLLRNGWRCISPNQAFASMPSHPVSLSPIKTRRYYLTNMATQPHVPKKS